MSHEGIRFVSPEDQARAQAAAAPLSRTAITPAKVRVLLTEGKGLEIDWSDGHKSVWTFAWLREACPCATCNDEREKKEAFAGSTPAPSAVLPMFKPKPRAQSATQVGNYAIQINFNDGHSTGIFSWEYFFELGSNREDYWRDYLAELAEKKLSRAPAGR